MKPGKKFEAGVCSNGGIWMNGECDCPVGFIGDKCNEGCGPNRFGPSCEAKCSETDRMCREMIFCKRFFGCYCAPGYKGKYCSKICAANEYGVSCSQNCGKCLRDGCDPYTGRCPSGCLAGYVPPTCHTKYVHLIKPPSVEADFNNASLKVDIKNSTAGIGEPQYNQIQIRDDTFKNWTTSILEDIPADGMILFNITNLKAGTRYYCRVVLLDINGEKYEGDETPASSFETKCINDTKFYVTNTSSTYSLSLCWESTPSLKNCPVNASVVEILIDKKWVSYTEIGFCLKISNLLPDSAYIIKIKPINAPTFIFLTLNTTSYISGFVKDMKVNYIGMDEVELEWTPIHNSLYSLFNVSYLCLRIVADESLTCGCDRGTMETGNMSIRITGLKPFRKYRTEIKEIGGQGHSEIKFTTQQALPAVKVRSLTFLPRKSSAFVSWEPPENCSDCNGYLRGYHLSLKDPIGVVKSHSTKNTSELFQNLKPQNIYQLSVYVQNVLGWNEAYPVIADLKAEIERPSRVGQLEVYKQSRTQLGLRWDAPKFSFGTIVSYTVTVDAITFTHEPVACQAWPQKFCYTVNGLRANTYYNVSVSARNGLRDEDGEESWIVGQTMERAPGKPIDVKQINVTETSITLRWGPPNLLNGILKSFLLKIEQVESYDNEACCQYYPKSELNVNDERESYWVEIKNLHPGSTFAVSVMGETLWLGPAAGIDAFTRPPRPCSTLLPVVQPPLRWEDNPEEKCIFRQEPTLIQGHLLILINDNGGNRVIDPGLRCILEQELGTNFDMVAEYSKAVNVSLGSGNAPLNGSWGKLNNPPLVFGRNYTFVAFTVVRYNNLFNVASRYALPLNLLEADPLNETGKH